MDFSLIQNTVISGKKTFRTPFKVSCMSFSPHNDLIALGSKSGEVLMKRTTWKTIWKTNVGMVPAVGTVCTSESAVSALDFSPDGRYIAAATSKGLVHLLDVEAGKVRYSVKVANDDKITKLNWHLVRIGSSTEPTDFTTDFKHSQEAEDTIKLVTSKPDVSREEIGFVYQRLDEDGASYKHDEAQRENLEKTFITSTMFNESFRNTIILACIDDIKISVLVAGVFPYMQIDIEETISQYNQGLLMLYDMHYSTAFEGVSFVVTTYGPFVDCQQNRLLPPGNSPKPGQGCHTFMFHVKLSLDTALWDAALRYARLLFGFNLYTVSLDTTKQNWKEEMKELHNRFDTKTKAVRMGEVLIDLLLSGSTDPAGEAYLERGLGMDGLSAITHFIEKNMAEVSRIARGQLATSSRNLAFQRCEFATSIERSELWSDLSANDDSLYEVEPTARETNAWLKKLEDTINILDVKTRQLGLQCLTMMQDIGHLVKWMSLTKPFAKSMKVNSLIRMKRMDIAKVLRFIVDSFVTDKETHSIIDRVLFSLKEKVADENDLNKAEGFDEVDFLEQLEAKAEVERKKLIEKFHLKFDFSAFADENIKQEVEEEEEEEPDVFEPESDTEPAVQDSERPPANLDRVGSFFTEELDEKALAVLPKCCEKFDGILENRGKRMNEESVRKMGLAKVLSDLAKLLSNPQSLKEKKKPEVMFIFEIASSETHRGFTEVRISDLTPSLVDEQPPVSKVPGMKCCRRSIQVTVIEKNRLQSQVIVPTLDVPVHRHANVKEHIDGMFRDYTFEKISLDKVSHENVRPEEPMEVDGELRIDVNIDLLPEYNTMVEYNRVFPLRHGELVIVGKFSSTQPNTGLAPRIMRTISSYPHKVAELKDTFSVHVDPEGKMDASIEMMIVHPTTEMTAYLHDEGSKITIGDLKPELPVAVDSREFRPQRKTFRDYQRRREEYRDEMGVGNLNDIQYDVLVQEAMDENRELGRNRIDNDEF